MKKLLVANWKSNKSRDEVIRWMDEFEERIKTLVVANMVNNDIVICPPMPSVMFVGNRLLNRKLFGHVYLGVQDISPFPAGSYTGAVSARNLDGFFVKYAIVGHSERRKYFGETSENVAQKVDQALENGITPIVCVDINELEEQASLMRKDLRKRVVVAYEPVEYIGTGTAQDVSQVRAVIDQVKELFPDSPILYGGSVNPDNISQFKNQPDVSGYLVGSASLQVDSFLDLL